MLLKSNVTAFSLPSDEWNTERLAKFTSSEIHSLMGEKGIGVGGYSYIYRKVGEELSGRPAKDDVLTAATAHGNEYELEGLKLFCERKEVPLFDGKYPIIQRLVTNGERFGSTPDGIWVLNESEDGLSYNVRTIEMKCPYSFDGYIKLWKCKTPVEVKKVEPKYYWQILDQMVVCDCLQGFLGVYQPFFKVGQLNIVEFRKIDLVPDFKLLIERKNQAVEIFNQVRSELMNS